jgi:flavin reductase (DIM6/NTAB) family NADH-FMN oxidoreductase RutF
MKIEVGAKTCLYLLPAILVGALPNGKPNYIVITHVGITAGSVSLGMNKYHYTNGGTKMNRTFSVNFQSAKLLAKETDYCVLVSGKNMDKASCFKTFMER